MDLLARVESKYKKEKTEEFNPGDTVKVFIRIKEADKERIQVFQGVVIQKRGQGLSQTFTVRKVSSGIGVERIFPLHSPTVSRIEVVRPGKVKSAKLFYLRKTTGKAGRIKEKREEREEREEEQTSFPESTE